MQIAGARRMRSNRRLQRSFQKKKILSSSEKEQNDGRKSKSITISKMKLFRMSCWEEDNNNNKNDSNEIVNKKVIEGQQDY
jgi:hypothetical protein